MGGGQGPGEQVSSGPDKGVGTAAAGAPGRAGPCRRGGGPGLRQAGRGARRASTRPGDGGAGLGAGVPAQAPARPWLPRRALIQKAPLPPPPGPAAARPGLSSRGPSLRPPPRFPCRCRLSAVPASSLGLFPASVPSAPSSRPPAPAPAAPRPCPHPFPFPVPADSQPLPPGGSTFPSHLPAGGFSGWGGRGDEFGVFIILHPSNDGQPSPDPAAGCLGTSSAPRPEPFQDGLVVAGVAWPWRSHKTRLWALVLPLL